MPVQLGLMEQLLFINLNAAPGPLLDLLGSLAFRTVLAGVRLGAFESLEESPKTPAELAASLSCDAAGMQRLLEALEPLGYVAERDSSYANTPMTSKWLVHTSPENIVSGILFWGMALRELWGNLEESLQSGKPPVDFYPWIGAHPAESKDFQDWMAAVARLGMDEVASRLRLSSQTRRLLDIGGGHGAYSIGLCQRYPNLEAAIIDAPHALEAARKNIHAAGLEQRITLMPGDFFTEDLGRDYDLALLFNIIHAFSPAQNRTLFSRAAGALKPGGRLAVMEQISGKLSNRAARTASSLFGLNYFHLFGAGTFTFRQIAGWIEEAGLTQIRRANLLKAPGTALVLGKKP